MKTVLHVIIFVITVSTHRIDKRASKTETSAFANFDDEIFRNKRNKEFNQALEKYSPVLKTVGLFIAGHKYLAKDARFRGREFLGERSYYRHFPIPRLKTLYLDLKIECNRGAFSCIQKVYSKAIEYNSNNSRSANPYWPFYDKLDLFKYRTTASYYLCMFTQQKNVMMRSISYPGECLDGFSDTKDAREAGVTIKDWRRDTIPFQCSRIYYCPDPCYGKTTNGNVESMDAQRYDKGNPCRNLRINHCDWSPGENTNFEGLIRNRFNITCACHFEKSGFKWSSRFKMCVDQDECHERTTSCMDGKVCQNTKGGYVCVCKRGKRLNSATGKCEDMVLLPQLVNATSRRRVKKNKPSFIRRLEILLGVSSAGVGVSSAGWQMMLSYFGIWLALAAH